MASCTFFVWGTCTFATICITWGTYSIVWVKSIYTLWLTCLLFYFWKIEYIYINIIYIIHSCKISAWTSSYTNSFFAIFRTSLRAIFSTKSISTKAKTSNTNSIWTTEIFTKRLKCTEILKVIRACNRSFNGIFRVNLNNLIFFNALNIFTKLRNSDSNITIIWRTSNLMAPHIICKTIFSWTSSRI